MPAPPLRLRPSGAPLRCPCCLDVLVPERGAPLPLAFCRACGTASHEPCLAELGRCPIRGCERPWAPPPAPTGELSPIPWDELCAEEAVWVEVGGELHAAHAWGDAASAGGLAPTSDLEPISGDGEGSGSGGHPSSSGGGDPPRPVAWETFCREAGPWLRLGEELVAQGAWAEVSWDLELSSEVWTLVPSGSGSAAAGAGPEAAGVDDPPSGSSSRPGEA